MVEFFFKCICRSSSVFLKLFQSRIALSHNMPMQVTKVYNSLVTKVVHNRHFTKRVPAQTLCQQFSKISGKLARNIAVEAAFRIFMERRQESSNCLKGTLLKTLFQDFTEIFKTTVFLNSPWKMHEARFCQKRADSTQ